MNSSRVALIATFAAVVSWTLKSVAIGTAGGLDKSPFEGPLFLAGLTFFLIGVAALGVVVTRGRPGWVRVAGGVVAPILGFGLALGVDAFVAAMRPESPSRHWVWAEVNLWVMAAGVLTFSLVVHARQSARRPSVG